MGYRLRALKAVEAIQQRDNEAHRGGCYQRKKDDQQSHGMAGSLKLGILKTIRARDRMEFEKVECPHFLEPAGPDGSQKVACPLFPPSFLRSHRWASRVALGMADF